MQGIFVKVDRDAFFEVVVVANAYFSSIRGPFLHTSQIKIICNIHSLVVVYIMFAGEAPGNRVSLIKVEKE